MKKNKGFTLIELLAIIVILAIIAVITVPIILNIIENTRIGAAQDSAYGYKDAVDKYYVSELFDNNNVKLDGNYTIENGKLKGNNLPAMGVEIPANGTIPSSGTLTYENNVFKSGCLVMGEYAVTFNTNGTTNTEKGNCSNSGFANITYSFSNIVNGVSYASPKKVKENPVYFDPTEGAFCTREEYEENDPTPDTGVYKKTGCMKWYAYSKNSDGTINLLLDHNTTSSVEWIKDETDYLDGASVGITYPSGYTLPNWDGENYSGPVTALKQLKLDTDSWSDNLIRNDSYNINYTHNSSEYVNDEWVQVERTTNYTINYGNYKARLISAEEVIEIAKLNVNITEARDGLYFNTEGWLTNNKYSWLYNYTGSCKSWTPQCDVDANETNQNGGYYTSTPSLGDGNDSMWYVRQYGGLSDEGGVHYSMSGIRPVITISASISETDNTQVEMDTLVGLCSGAVSRKPKGATITIAGEEFYVINSNECITTLIAAENISPTTGKQDGDVRTDEVFATSIEQLYGNNPYPYVYNSNSNYYDNINNYKNYLNNNDSIKIITARLASYEELASVGCSTSNYSCPDWIRNTKFYLGSSKGYAYSNDIWYVDNSNGKLLTQGPSYVNMGIRPVILISTADLD